MSGEIVVAVAGVLLLKPSVTENGTVPDPVKPPDVTDSVACVGPTLLPDHVSKEMVDGVLKGTFGTVQVRVFACVSIVGSPRPADADRRSAAGRSPA